MIKKLLSLVSTVPSVSISGEPRSAPILKVVKVYNGRAEIENRIKEDKNALRWDKTSSTLLPGAFRLRMNRIGPGFARVSV
jgi:hypothetical protein